MPRVIVSGAGSLTGFEVIRALAGAGFEVWGTDLTERVPAREHAARIVVAPRVGAGDYLPFVEALCADAETVAYLPILIDEIILLAERTALPAEVLAPDAEIAALMKSKRALAAFCRDAGIRAAAVLARDTAHAGPVLVKDARFVQDRSRRRAPERFASAGEVPDAVWDDPDRIVCEHVAGDELVVHALSDLRGGVTRCVAMRRLEMRGGHDVRCETVPLDPGVARTAERVLGALAGRRFGPVDMQLVGDTLIDLDFNFPSALPVFAASGLDSPAALVRSLGGAGLPEVRPSYHGMVRDLDTREVELS